MIAYNCIKQNSALSTAADFFTLISGATRSFLVVELDFAGDGSSSTYQEMNMARVTAAGTGTAPTATVPQSVDDPAVTLAFSGTFYTGAYGTSPPTPAAVPLHNLMVNANGVRALWKCNPAKDNAYSVPGGAGVGGTLSFRGFAGTGNVSGRVQIVEI
jgi:hypothetical protein